MSHFTLLIPGDIGLRLETSDQRHLEFGPVAERAIIPEDMFFIIFRQTNKLFNQHKLVLEKKSFL